MKYVQEETRLVPLAGEAEVIVVGGGPAGVCAAVAAARGGADTLLIETNGCLGGMWTAGCMGLLLDVANKGEKSLIREIMDSLAAGNLRQKNLFDVEGMKFFLEEWCQASGVRIRYFTTLADVVKDGERIDCIITESKSGREAWRAKVFIDCTGDGDLGFKAGNPYEAGHLENGLCQPMSLLALLTGLDIEEVRPYCQGGGEWQEVADRFSALLKEGDYQPSYQGVALFHLGEGMFFLMANHQYGKSGLSAADLTEATLAARSEINRQIAILRSRGGIWKNVKLAATAEKIGVRESRRLTGAYMVTLADLAQGRCHEDGIAKVSFCIDVHALRKDKDCKIETPPVKTMPYEVPLRALISLNVENLLFAGRCISGDFFAHASYRVTGNAAQFGEAAGALAALSSTMKIPVRKVDCQLVQEKINWEKQS